MPTQWPKSEMQKGYPLNQNTVASRAQWLGEKFCQAAIWLAIAYVCVSARGGAAISAEPHQPTKRVLILYAVNTILPIHLDWERGIRSALQAGIDGPLDIDVEFTDLLRFEDPVYVEKLISLLQHKYSSHKVDVVIPVYDDALEFVRRHGESVFPGAAVVFCSVQQDTLKGMKLGPNITGVTYSFDSDGTLELARKLWPQTRHVALVSGVDASGRQTEAQARRAFTKYSSELEFTYFSGTPIDILKDEVQRLPSDTVIFVLSYVLDSRGASVKTTDVVSNVSRVANAPVFGFYETLFGHGLLGGHLVPVEKQGRLAGEMTVRVLHGEDPARVPVAGSQMHEYMFDWRELRHWRIPKSSLPTESVVRYREPNLWDLYKYYLLGGLGLVILQSLLIVVLLVNRRRRRRAEANVKENLLFEQVLSTLSSRFVDPPYSGIGQIVAQSLQEIAEVLDFQRAALFEFSPGEEELRATHQWAVGGMELPEQLTIDELPWMFTQLGKGETVQFSRRDELPAEAAAERDYFRQAGVRSGIAIPLTVGDIVLGAVTFGCIAREQPWNETIVQRLRLFGEILANTISRQRASEALGTSQNEARELRGRLLIVQEDERKRLARELHDDVSQRLAGTAIGAGKLQQLLATSNPVSKLAGDLTDELVKIAEDVHRISRQLHPSILDDLGLTPALQSECERFSERDDIRVRYRCQNVPTTLPADAALCIYRIAQEALRNAVKHSGAHAVDVALTADAEYLYLSVKDAGCGFDMRDARGRPGLGFASMDERARLAGGVLTVQSHPGQGTLIEARIPLPEDEL